VQLKLCQGLLTESKRCILFKGAYEKLSKKPVP